MKKYRVIYADPPWNYNSKQPFRSDGVRFHALEKEYSTMTTKDICNIPIKDISEKDSALFMWVTDSHIPDALEVVSSWGFKYKTVAFVWEKVTVNGNPVMNLGAWTMKSYELCLLATKGQMKKYKIANNIPQKVWEIREKHSRKPNEVRKRIKRLFGNLLSLELFAREKHEGWDVWGNEVKSDIEL